jgi:hypothetical protein
MPIINNTQQEVLIDYYGFTLMITLGLDALSCVLLFVPRTSG